MRRFGTVAVTLLATLTLYSVAHAKPITGTPSRVSLDKSAGFSDDAKRPYVQIENDFYKLEGKDFIFRVHEIQTLDYPLDAAPDGRKYDVYRLYGADAAGRIGKYRLSEKPVLSFEGGYSFTANTLPPQGQQPVMDAQSLLHVNNSRCCMIFEEAYYRLSDGKAIFEQALDIGEAPKKGAAAFQDAQGKWLLVAAEYTLSDPAAHTLTLQLHAYTAAKEMHHRYSVTLSPEVYTHCVCDPAKADPGCGINVVLTQATQGTSDQFIYTDPAFGSEISVMLDKMELVNFHLTAPLEITQPKSIFAYKPLP